jgi:hypothetical protein
MDTKVYYRGHKSLLIVSVLSQIFANDLSKWGCFEKFATR